VPAFDQQCGDVRAEKSRSAADENVAHRDSYSFASMRRTCSCTTWRGHRCMNALQAASLFGVGKFPIYRGSNRSL
jgi:hypothetical protein